MLYGKIFALKYIPHHEDTLVSQTSVIMLPLIYNLDSKETGRVWTLEMLMRAQYWKNEPIPFLMGYLSLSR